MKTIVAKFGGSSVANTQRMFNCAEIVAKNPNIQIVVVSATYKTTDQLVEIIQLAKKGESFQTSLDELKKKHYEFAAQLKQHDQLLMDLGKVFEELTNLVQGVSLLRECSLKIMDQVFSIGERSSSLIATQVMQEVLSGQNRQVYLKDAREVIRTDQRYGNARTDTHKIKELVETHWNETLNNPQNLILTQGFIGSSGDGDTTTLGREGSDLTATLLGEAIQADHIEIWKDVPGIASTDPRLIKNAKFLPELSYSEMTELATLGAKVLHPDTLRPTMKKNIPVYIGSSYEPEIQGTWIKNSSAYTPLVQALALRQNQKLISLICRDEMTPNRFFSRVFQLFEKYNIQVDLVNTHEQQISFMMNENFPFPQQLMDDLNVYCHIQQEDDFSLVSIVGHGMSLSKGFMSGLFSLLDRYKIRQIFFGTGKHAISLLVDQTRGEEILNTLHHHFLEFKFQRPIFQLGERR